MSKEDKLIDLWIAYLKTHEYLRNDEKNAFLHTIEIVNKPIVIYKENLLKPDLSKAIK